MSMKVLSRLPGNLSSPVGTAASLPEIDIDFSYGLGGMGWLSAAHPDRPVRRQTAPFRKQQLDTAGQAGEQSLENWWYRSQFSFHGGAGQLYNDPNTRGGYSNVGHPEIIETRYASSCGVDVWTAGRLTLLPAMARIAAAPIVGVIGYSTATNKNMMMWATGAAVSQQSADTTYSGTTPAPAGETIVAICTDGANVFIATGDGIYRAAMPDGNGTMTWVQLWTITTTRVRIAWVKQRLIACLDTAVYELVSGGPTLPATPVYTHPNALWTWSSISEGARAIYVAGYAGGKSSIFKFIPQASDGNLPALSTGITAAEVPEGENIHAVYGYLGNLVGIGTSRGVRVGTTDENADIAYGPLIMETTEPVKCFAARDRFLYFGISAGMDGQSGLGRIDLGYSIDGLRFAYAWDVYHVASTSAVGSCTLVGNSDSVAYGTAADGLFYTDPTGAKQANGYLTTSRIRYSTVEPKLFKLLRIRGPVLDGGLGVSVVGMSGVESPLQTIAQGTMPSADIDIRAPSGPQEFLTIKFVLNRHTTDVTLGAELSSYQLKALPGTTRTRLIQLPVLCFDLEEDVQGQRWGEEGAAITRLQQIEAIEAGGDIVLWQDFSNDTGTLVTIEQLEFVQSAPPQNARGWGGYLNITLRTMT
jgi:hypothetical protein